MRRVKIGEILIAIIQDKIKTTQSVTAGNIFWPVIKSKLILIHEADMKTSKQNNTLFCVLFHSFNTLYASMHSTLILCVILSHKSTYHIFLVSYYVWILKALKAFLISGNPFAETGKRSPTCLSDYEWLSFTGCLENSDVENSDLRRKKTQTLLCLETSDHKNPINNSRISNTLGRYGELKTV